MSQSKNSKEASLVGKVSADKAAEVAAKADVADKASEAKKLDKAAKKKVKKTQTPGMVPVFLDRLLWLIAFIMVGGAIFGNWYYGRYYGVGETNLQVMIRTLVVIAVIVLGLGVVLFTNKGRKLLTFAGKAYTELLKVVWPTRQEAVQTTFIIFVAVCLVSLFLYLYDVIFLKLVGMITL